MALAVVSAALVSASPAAAQFGRPYPDSYGGRTDGAYDEGYRQGQRAGERDGRDGRGYSCDPNDAYRSWGRNRYDDGARRSFESGYEAGYREAFERYDRAVRRPRDDRYGYPDARGRGPSYGGGYGYRSPAVEVGYRDGYDEGLKAARGNDRYDPFGEKDYRKADHGYKGHYGPKDLYRRDYRDAFRDGYDAGFRDGGGRRGGLGRNRGGRWPWDRVFPF
ncbi:MAG: hypothetical protein U0Q12_06330 [Vicinamibacterales bacterium]